MAYQYLMNISIETAKAEYLERLIGNGMAPKSEMVPASEASGRVTSTPVYARISAPHHDTCTLDGIALDAVLTYGASSDAPIVLDEGQYRFVYTGEPVPDGCDSVIAIEDVYQEETSLTNRGRIKLSKAAIPWQNIRRLGEDICAGDMLLPSFSRLSPAALGVMYASGVKELEVIKHPIVGIIPTGDEPAPLGFDSGVADSLELNSTIFSAMLREWGAETVTFPIVKDDLNALTEALTGALSQCDIVILNAGLPAGNEGYSAAAIRNVGRVLYHGLAIKPGKPAILGYSGAKPLLGVPCYPVSGIIVVEQVVRPIIDYLCAGQYSKHEYVDAILSRPVVSVLDYKEFVRVRIGHVNNRVIATPLNRGSGLISSFMKADGILEVPQETESYESGDTVSVRLLGRDTGFMDSLVAVGSHDPLLDEISDLLRLKFGDVSMVSTNVGSMGGLIAVRRGEAHLAGTHLLDVKSGRYNEPFIKKVFPDGNLRLIECVKRIQGFILPKGNPLGIRGVGDLRRDGLRYVNRQQGSGSRILFDYLCSEAGFDPTGLDGYFREEYTHTSVASQVASGSADTGLAVFSVARMFNLDFVPVCEEQYDLLIPNHAWDIPLMQKLIAVLKSSEFRARMDAMGGYIVENPGSVRGEW